MSAHAVACGHSCPRRVAGGLLPPRGTVLLSDMGQQIPILTRELAQAAAALVHQDTPISHDQLDRLFSGVGLASGDPGAAGHGKTKRLRAVLDYAMAGDRKAGARLVARLVASLRGCGGFRADAASFIGEAGYLNLRDAFRASGFDLDRGGEIRQRVLDENDALESDEVLLSYVRRIQRGVDDAPLLTGTGKDLLEAAARRALHRAGRTYPGHDFPGVLYHAFAAAELPAPSSRAIQTLGAELNGDPRPRVCELLYLLGLTLNQLRNREGTGHGRAFLPSIDDDEAKTAAKSMALISEILLQRQGRASGRDRPARDHAAQSQRR
jgi:hypothetical protein